LIAHSTASEPVDKNNTLSKFSGVDSTNNLENSDLSFVG
jgi:hypothetical protein